VRTGPHSRACVDLGGSVVRAQVAGAVPTPLLPPDAVRSVTLRLAQDPSSENLGTTVWDASIVMAKYFEKVRPVPRGFGACGPGQSFAVVPVYSPLAPCCPIGHPRRTFARATLAGPRLGGKGPSTLEPAWDSAAWPLPSSVGGGRERCARASARPVKRACGTSPGAHPPHPQRANSNVAPLPEQALMWC
jgi:hypothetical protein